MRTVAVIAVLTVTACVAPPTREPVAPAESATAPTTILIRGDGTGWDDYARALSRIQPADVLCERTAEAGSHLHETRCRSGEQDAERRERAQDFMNAVQSPRHSTGI